MKKYEKPLARALNDVSIAFGHLCTSGTTPTQACGDGSTNVGPCDALGYSAGRDCTPVGSYPYAPTAPCTTGKTATSCATGKFASVRIPQSG